MTKRTEVKQAVQKVKTQSWIESEKEIKAKGRVNTKTREQNKTELVQNRNSGQATKE